MSALDPSRAHHSRRVDPSEGYLDGPASVADSSTMLLTLWSMQIETLRNTLVAQFAGTRERQESLRSVGELVGRVTTVHLQVQQQELAAVGDVLKQLRRGETPSGRNGIFARRGFANVISWASDRALSLTPVDSSVTSERSKSTEPGDALRENVARVQSYIQSIQTNSADNKRIRSLIERAPGIDRLFTDLKSHGHPHSLQSLRDLVTVGTSLSIQLHSVQKDLQRIAAQVRVVGDTIRLKSQEITKTSADFLRGETKRIVRSPNETIRQLRRDLQILEEQELRREFLDELLETLLHFEVLEDLRIERNIVSNSADRRPHHLDWNQVSSMADRWRSDLDTRLRSV